MSNKYLLKVATILDMNPDGSIARIHSDPHLENRARKAKLLNPSVSQRAKKALSSASFPLAVGAAGYAGYRVGKLVNKAREKKAELSTSNHKKDVLNTGVIAAAGGVTNTIADRILHPHTPGGGMKAFALGTGLGVLGDYAAVKINNKINQHLDGSKAP